MSNYVFSDTLFDKCGCWINANERQTYTTGPYADMYATATEIVAYHGSGNRYGFGLLFDRDPYRDLYYDKIADRIIDTPCTMAATASVYIMRSIAARPGMGPIWAKPRK